MDTPDIFKGLETIGKWESFRFGCRWELTNNEIERALGKIDVQRNSVAVMGGLSTVVAGFAFPGIGALVAGSSTATIIGLYELLKARITSVNEGNGVIVDFAFNPNYKPSFYTIGENLVAGLSQTIGLQISNIRPR